MYSRQNIPSNQWEAELQSCFDELRLVRKEDRTKHISSLKIIIHNSTGELHCEEQLILRRYFDTITLARINIDAESTDIPDESGKSDQKNKNMKEFELVKRLLNPEDRLHIEYEYEVYRILHVFSVIVLNPIAEFHKYLDLILGIFYKPGTPNIKRHAIKNAIREFFKPSDVPRYKEEHRGMVVDKYIKRSPDHTYNLNSGLSFNSNYNESFRYLLNEISPITNPFVDAAIRKQNKRTLANITSRFAIHKSELKPDILKAPNTTIKTLPDELVRDHIAKFLGGSKRKNRRSLQKNKKQRCLKKTRKKKKSIINKNKIVI
jgi:hypothetical protein